jgi:hypothetical protein
MSKRPENLDPKHNPSVLARRNWWQTKLVKFIAKRTPRCPEIVRIISQGMDRPLSWRTRAMLQIHYLICGWCRRYEKQVRFIREATHEFPEHMQEASRSRLSDEEKAKIKRSLHDTA